MDCLRSFNFLASGQANFVAPEVKTWFVGAQEFWTFERSGSSTFSPQGFKNIDVYKIEVIGNFGTYVVPVLGGAIPSDWSIRIKVNGLPSLLGGVVAVTNDFNINITPSNTSSFDLGRFKPSVEFTSPFKSVTSFEITKISANGTGGQTAGNVNLQYNLNFVIYYKFEGE